MLRRIALFRFGSRLRLFSFALALTALALGPAIAPLFAWGEHVLGSYPALRAMPELQNAPSVPAESLADFILAEEAGLVGLLKAEEAWSRDHLEAYPPRPDHLEFRATGERATAEARFLRALRINPEIRLANAVQLLPGDGRSDCRRLPMERVTIFENNLYWAGVRFCELSRGERAAPIAIAASASDEPDYGHDVGLFSDNGTDFGAEYGWGVQSFGNPKLEFSSQAPFHMGFYHESAVIYAAAGFLKRTYPEYRARIYLQLSRFAFRTGHDYWGYRFLGWGLHYVQDLTQPYHSTVMPGAGTTRMLCINSLAMLGWTGARDDAVQLLSNRHLALEDLQRKIMKRRYLDGKFDHAIFEALAESRADAQYGAYSEDYLRKTVAAESNARAEDLDEMLAEVLPAQYVDDPGFSFDSTENPEDLYAVMLRDRAAAEEELSRPLGELFRSFGAHSRNYARAALLQR